MDDLDHMPETQHLELVELASSSNEKLENAGSQGAEQAFGLGCVLGGLPLAALVIALYIWGVLPFIVAFVVFVMGTLVVLGGVTLVAFNAKKRAIGETYRKEVGPDIQAYLRGSKIHAEQFSNYVTNSLPEDAPLRTVHTVLPPSIDIPDQE
jgi:hypothetical protein